MTDVADPGLLPTSELTWVRFQLGMLADSRHLCPLSVREQAHYDELCRLEIELLATIRP